MLLESLPVLGGSCRAHRQNRARLGYGRWWCRLRVRPRRHDADQHADERNVRSDGLRDQPEKWRFGRCKRPTAYRDFNFSRTTALGYDTKNNPFVDGLDQSTFFHYAEFAGGGEAFTDITLNGFPSTQGAGGIQWDGTYMVVGDSEQTLYRTQGSNVIGTTALTALCPFAFYIVPSSGSPTKAITSGLSTPYGAVLSR
jgi:hypothetical protein